LKYSDCFHTFLGYFNLKGKYMKTRKGGDLASLLRLSKKSYEDNEKDCVDFFNEHDLYLPQNKKKWNSFVQANPQLKLPELKGETANQIFNDYERKQFCGEPDIVKAIRFPGSFRKGTGINYTLSLNGGKRRKRTKRSK